jgi:hypothetical protein
MHSFQVVTGAELLVAAKYLNLVVEVQLLKEPYCALAARFLKPAVRSALCLRVLHDPNSGKIVAVVAVWRRSPVDGDLCTLLVIGRHCQHSIAG